MRCGPLPVVPQEQALEPGELLPEPPTQHFRRPRQPSERERRVSIDGSYRNARGPASATNTQERTFEYRSLGSLIEATNPENVRISYSYNDDGSPYQVTNARSISTTFGYDTLRRVTWRAHDGKTAEQAADAQYVGFAGDHLFEPVP
jgi:YD repeat-containing protein